MKASDTEDSVNLRILRCLAEHGRMPHTKIAQTLGLSPNAVRDRILSMERRGVILNYHAVPDERQLGQPWHVLALLQPTQPQPDAVRLARTDPHIVGVSHASGRFGLLVEAIGASMEEIDDALATCLYSRGYEPASFVALRGPLSTGHGGSNIEGGTGGDEVMA